MKNKIILFLSFLMIAVCLTGCSQYVVEKEQFGEMPHIVEDVVNQKEYELQQELKISFYDLTTNNREIISDIEDMDVVFDVTSDISLAIFFIFLFLVVTIGCVVVEIISKRISKKSKKRKSREGRY